MYLETRSFTAAVNNKCVDVSKKMIDNSQDTQKLSKLDIAGTAMRTYYE